MGGFADDSPLGRQLPAENAYSAGLLYPIARSQARAGLRLAGAATPFQGADCWTAWELSWLDARGKPCVGIGEFEFPADSPCLMESKSLKLYLNSLNFLRLASSDELVELIRHDLSASAGAPVAVALYNLGNYPDAFAERCTQGTSLDGLDVDIDCYRCDPDLLRLAPGEPVAERVFTDLFRSCCPVTGQPDWATVFIDYRGRPLDHAALLAYLVSYRHHAGFHEQCVEQIFLDLHDLLQPEWLTVSARFLRRGGLDINPWRSTGSYPLLPQRQLRQ